VWFECLSEQRLEHGAHNVLHGARLGAGFCHCFQSASARYEVAGERLCIAARPDVAVALHLHTDAGVAVAAQRDGLLPISQLAMNVMSDVAYHDYEGLALDAEEKDRLVKDLGEHHLMILRNHGTLSVGAHPFQAYLRIYLLERACKIQTMAQNGGGELIQWDKAMQDRVYKQGEEGIVNELFLEIAWAAVLDRVRRQSPGFEQ